MACILFHQLTIGGRTKKEYIREGVGSPGRSGSYGAETHIRARAKEFATIKEAEKFMEDFKMPPGNWQKKLL